MKFPNFGAQNMHLPFCGECVSKLKNAFNTGLCLLIYMVMLYRHVGQTLYLEITQMSHGLLGGAIGHVDGQ